MRGALKAPRGRGPLETRMLVAKRNVLRRENAKYGASMVVIPKEQWPPSGGKVEPVRVFRSRDFLCQEFIEAGATRLSICRAELDMKTGRWRDGITWDELMQVKRQCGYGNAWAVEIFPPDAEVVNVANMRHLFVVPTAPSFAWRKTTPRCFNCEETTGPLMCVTKGVAPALPGAYHLMIKHGVNSIRLCEQCFGAFHCRGEFIPDGEEAA